MASNVATLVVKVIADAKQARSELDSVGKSGKFQKGLATASKGAAVALAGIGAAAIAAGKAAAEDAQSQAVLATAMKNTTGAHKDQIASMEDFISKTAMATGVADDQLRPAMATLLRSTGDAAKSQDALNAALDISAATGKDVGSVSDALAKGYAGNTTALGRLVPGIDKAVLATGDMDAIMAELARTTGGAAAASANTAAGQFQRFKLGLDETQESIGGALLPIMAKLAPMLLTVATWAQKNSTVFVILAGAIAGIAAAVLIVNAALKVYQATMLVIQVVQKATWLSALGPIGLVIAAVALVVGAIVLLWKKSETFRAVVLAVWGAIKTAATVAANVVKAVWHAVWTALSAYVRVYLAIARAVFNGVRAAANAVAAVVRTVWRGVWSAVSTYVRTYVAVVRAVFNAIRTVVSTVTSYVKTAWHGVWSTLQSAARTAGSVLSAPFHTVKSAVDSVISAVRSLIGWLSNIHVPKISLPHLPGKSAPAPAGLTTRAAPFTAAGAASVRTSTASPGGGITINVTGALDPEAVARQIDRLLSAHARRVGVSVR